MKMLGLAVVILAAAGLTVGAHAQTQAPLRGHLVDVACSSQHATEADFIAKHDKKCLLMDACIKSGYSLVTADGKMLKLDAKGNQIALELVKKTERESKWVVAVTGKVSGDTIAVSDIQLQ